MRVGAQCVYLGAVWPVSDDKWVRIPPRQGLVTRLVSGAGAGPRDAHVEAKAMMVALAVAIDAPVHAAGQGTDDRASPKILSAG